MPKAASTKNQNMNSSEELTSTDEFTSIKKIAHELDAKKGDHVKIYDLRQSGSYIGIAIVVTALSDLHIKNLTREATDIAAEFNEKPVYPNQPVFDSGWVVLDFGYYVIHILSAEKREFYRLDEKLSKGITVEL